MSLVPTPVSGAPEQLPAIDPKYRRIYDCIEHLVKLVVAEARIPQAQKYDRCRSMVPAIWSKAGTERLLKMDLQELDKIAKEYWAQPASWYLRGALHSGTNADADSVRDKLVARELAQHVPKDCDLVIEMGSGWGQRLLDLWRAGGPKDALYLGCERAAAGRRCLEAAAKGFLPEVKVATHPFDFLEPAFAIPGADTYRAVAVVSILAIEQVRYLGAGFFETLLRAFPKARLTGVHIEPATFQIPGEAEANPERYHLDAAFADKFHYNVDLYPEIARRKDMQVTAIDPGIYVNKGAGNSETLIAWRRIPA